MKQSQSKHFSTFPGSGSKISKKQGYGNNVAPMKSSKANVKNKPILPRSAWFSNLNWTEPEHLGTHGSRTFRRGGKLFQEFGLDPIGNVPQPKRVTGFECPKTLQIHGLRTFLPSETDFQWFFLAAFDGEEGNTAKPRLLLFVFFRISPRSIWVFRCMYPELRTWIFIFQGNVNHKTIHLWLSDQFQTWKC